jgi:hypothetical protein
VLAKIFASTAQGNSPHLAHGNPNDDLGGMSCITHWFSYDNTTKKAGNPSDFPRDLLVLYVINFSYKGLADTSRAKSPQNCLFISKGDRHHLDFCIVINLISLSLTRA